MPHTYSIFEAKAKLSELLRLVKNRQPVTITERGKPIAIVSPYSESSNNIEERLRQAEERGEVIRASGGTQEIEPLATKPGALKRFYESRD